MKSYVEYSSNNSGGHWWLSDDDWKALEAAGWKVGWVSIEHAFTDNGNYVHEDDGTPKLVPVGEGNGKYGRWLDEDGRYLGALAKTAWKIGATSLRDAAADWERATGKSSTEAGCPCCGQPHNFTLYQDGKYVESGPTADYIASW